MGQAAELGTFLWIGNGARPTYAVVEYALRWRWPEMTGKVLRQSQQQWPLYTLDHKPITLWSLADV